MRRKLDLILSWLLLAGGLWYFGLVFAWERFGLEYAYFPAIALMNVTMGIINILRIKAPQSTIIKCAVPVNTILTGYALYVGYLCAVAGILTLPPIMAMCWMVVVLCFSLRDLAQLQRGTPFDAHPISNSQHNPFEPSLQLTASQKLT